MSIIEQVENLLSGPRPLPIVTAGDPVLRRTAEPYDRALPAHLFTELLTAMRDTMIAAPGVGLAAPQIGLGLQVAVLEDVAAIPADAAKARNRSPFEFRVLVNPTYTAVGDAVSAFYEGCLSVPGYQAVVERSASVRLRAADENGNAVDEIVSGWAARIVAHEVDHLRGMLYLDRALLRSLASNDNYMSRWATPTPLAARVQLGF